MQIFVKTLIGRTITLEVESATYVETIKEMIFDKGEASVCDQRLIHEMKELENERQLADYGIKKEDTIQLITRLKGG